MQRFLSNLIRSFRTTKTAGPARRAPRRANLQVEGLEDRMVPTTVTQSGPLLTINNIAPNHNILFFLAPSGHGQLEVLDNGVLINPNHLFNIASINAVNITVAGGNAVGVNDNFGMPFAPGTAITLNGSGANNLLTLTGDLAISGSETYVAGGASFTPGMVSVDGLTFNLHSAITSVFDFFLISGTLDVQTSGSNVVLASTFGVDQTLSGMGFGGGDTLTYAGKPTVQLDEYAASAIVTLNAPARATGENFFKAQMHGAGDITVIKTTPSNVFTDVSSVVAPVANPALVLLLANAGAVSIEGNASTSVQIGQFGSNSSSTQGIQANVEVLGVGSLTLSDIGSGATQVVTVTQSTIDGLFGNSKAFLSYLEVGALTIQTGHGTDQYDVFSIGDGAFNTRIEIDDFSTSTTGFIANVGVQPDNHLNLRLVNEHPQVPAQLFLNTGNGTVSTSNPAKGVEVIDVNFPGKLPSELVVTDFSFIKL